MCGKGALFFKLVIFFVGQSTATQCDQSTTAKVQEGNLGQTSDFNWIGVLRVHLHDGDSLQLAMTGIVLIKKKHAIANADDIVRIPTRIFKTDTQAMFIGVADTPWYAQPVSYVCHPEYEYSASNSIAIVELNLDDVETYPLNPICLPDVMYNTSNYLYLTGYSDENKYLEKVFYKIQYLGNEACEEFYNRVGLSNQGRQPISYICGYAPTNKTHCVWDNGMALVSNATGWFNLIGFGIHGPGCAAPARFIDIAPYLHWINAITTEEVDMYESPEYRRHDSIEYIPAHELFVANASLRKAAEGDDLMRTYRPYPFDVEKPRHFKIEPYEEDAIAIYPFDEMFSLYNQSCLTGHKTKMYQERFVVKSNKYSGDVAYKLSLYDLIQKLCVCVILKIQCTHREQAVLSFREDFHFDLGTLMSESAETPEELFRYYPITERTVQHGNTKTKHHKKSKYNITRPQYLKQDTRYGRVLNYDLYIKFHFEGEAILKFDMLSSEIDESSSPLPPLNLTTKARRKKLFWGMGKKFFSKRVKQPAVTIVEEHEEVQETVSTASLMTKDIVAFGPLAMFCLRKCLG